jgi:predicted ATPase
MLALIVDGDEEGIVPPTIHALIAARLDALPADERELAERASVIGKEFDREAVGELVPQGLTGDVDSCLLRLVRKELIRPAHEGGNFAFAHLLIRDAAYEALPKELRAELHERFAGYLDSLADVPEADEIIGHHLEQAYRYHDVLGSPHERGGRLGEQAAERLAAAGRRAQERGDMPAALNLLDRASGLLAADSAARLALLPDLGSTLLRSGDFRRGRSVLEEAIERAGVTGDVANEQRARIDLLDLRMQSEPGLPMELFVEEIEEAVGILAELGDDSAVAHGLRVLSQAHLNASRYDLMQKPLERALVHAGEQACAARRWTSSSGCWPARRSGPPPQAWGSSAATPYSPRRPTFRSNGSR